MGWRGILYPLSRIAWIADRVRNERSGGNDRAGGHIAPAPKRLPAKAWQQRPRRLGKSAGGGVKALVVHGGVGMVSFFPQCNRPDWGCALVADAFELLRSWVHG